MNKHQLDTLFVNPQTILDDLPTGVTVQDASGKIVYANKAAAILTGYPNPSQLITGSTQKIMNKFILLGEDGNTLTSEQVPGRKSLLSKKPEESIIRFQEVGGKKDYWSLVKASPIKDEKGKTFGVVNSFLNVTHIKKSEQAIDLLNNISTTLSSFVTVKDRIEQLIDIIIPTLSDWCAIYIQNERNELERIVLYHRDRRKIKKAKEIESRYLSKDNPNSAMWSVITKGKAVFFPVITKQAMHKSVPHKEILPALLYLGIHSAAILPLKARGKTIGVMILARSETSNSYLQEDHIFLQNLANKLALLIDNSYLFDIAQQTIATQAEIQQKLEQSHETLRFALATGHMAIWDWNLKQNTISLSDGLNALYGISRRSPNNIKELLSYIHPSDLPHFLKHMDNAIDEKGAYHVEYRIVRPDKSVRWIHSQGQVLTNVNGEASRIIGIGMDITERKLAEEAIAQNQQKFQLIFETALDSIIVTDNKMSIVDANPSSAHVFGYSPRELVGHKLSSFIVPQEKQNLKKQWHILMKQGSYKGEILIQKQHGKANYAEYHATARYQTNRHLFVFRDINDRKEEENRREHLLGIASHELRTPLASIKAYIHILTRMAQKKSTADPLGYLGKIDEKADTLAKLINDLLDVTRIKQETFELVYEIFDFDQLMAATVQDLKVALPAHKISYKGKTRTTLVADKSRVIQVLTNLVKNASKYSPENSFIEIKVKRFQKKVSVSVTDHGIGIPKSEQRKIFDLYYQGQPGKHSEPSLGVGLFISSEIIKQHGGTLTVSSKVDHGSTFTFTLPIHTFE